MKGEAVEGRVGLPWGVTLFRNTLNSAAVPGDKEKTNLIYWNTRPKKTNMSVYGISCLTKQKSEFPKQSYLISEHPEERNCIRR